MQGIAGLVAFWRLGDTSAAALADSGIAGHGGTYPVTPAAFEVADLTTAVSDAAAVNFGAVGYGVVPHHADFSLAAFSVSFKFKMNALPTMRAHLFSKDASGNNDGDSRSASAQAVALKSTSKAPPPCLL